MGLSIFNACTDCTEAVFVFVGFSVTSERSYQVHVLMLSSGFDERATSAQLGIPSLVLEIVRYVASLPLHSYRSYSCTVCMSHPRSLRWEEMVVCSTG